MKRCKVCTENKHNSMYYRDAKAADGLRGDCKVCAIESKMRSRLRLFRQDPWLFLLKQKEQRAAANGMEFTLTEAWLRANTPTACPYTGVPFRFTEPGTVGRGFSVMHSSAPTFDRIDNGFGYTPENTEIVSWAYNQFKREMHPETLLCFCRAVVEKADRESEDDLQIREARGL